MSCLAPAAPPPPHHRPARTSPFRQPQSWIPQDLADLNVVQQSLPAAALIGDEYLPSDDDTSNTALPPKTLYYLR